MPVYMRTFIKMLVLGLLVFSAAYMVLIAPDIAANTIIGPYPVESDFKRLSENGVETIVSLLDPALYYEKQLLDEETALAKQDRMRLLNFPMTSFLGHK